MRFGTCVKPSEKEIEEQEQKQMINCEDKRIRICDEAENNEKEEFFKELNETAEIEILKKDYILSKRGIKILILD